MNMFSFCPQPADALDMPPAKLTFLERQVDNSPTQTFIMSDSVITLITISAILLAGALIAGLVWFIRRRKGLTVDEEKEHYLRRSSLKVSDHVVSAPLLRYHNPWVDEREVLTSRSDGGTMTNIDRLVLDIPSPLLLNEKQLEEYTNGSSANVSLLSEYVGVDKPILSQLSIPNPHSPRFASVVRPASPHNDEEGEETAMISSTPDSASLYSQPTGEDNFSYSQRWEPESEVLASDENATPVPARTETFVVSKLLKHRVQRGKAPSPSVSRAVSKIERKGSIRSYSEDNLSLANKAGGRKFSAFSSPMPPLPEFQPSPASSSRLNDTKPRSMIQTSLDVPRPVPFPNTFADASSSPEPSTPTNHLLTHFPFPPPPVASSEGSSASPSLRPIPSGASLELSSAFARSQFPRTKEAQSNPRVRELVDAPPQVRTAKLSQKAQIQSPSNRYDSIVPSVHSRPFTSESGPSSRPNTAGSHYVRAQKAANGQHLPFSETSHPNKVPPSSYISPLKIEKGKKIAKRPPTR